MTIDLIKIDYQIAGLKTTKLVSNFHSLFDVDVKLNKPQIKALIENLYKVRVTAVNTHRPPRKKKRLGGILGYKPTYKRVIVTTLTELPRLDPTNF